MNLEISGTSLSNQDGYVAHNLLTDQEKKWSIAILDVIDAAAHFHKVEDEHFMVLEGELDIVIDGVHHLLKTGQSIHLQPGIIHHLKSTSNTPVRLLCVNFPAFDPSDFHPIK